MTLQSNCCLNFVFYLDDGTSGVCLEDMLHDINTVENVAGELGLQLNRGKCEVICFDPEILGKFICALEVL